ncbi:TPA: hypothetical protein QDB08_004491 [Burkholderia vietnamiensis]|uniref:hypothetical protein n=1 Tax=Burkholderia vietnamiensis TaxID=60552 RepID=UPI001593BACA|nr:hypothetical protein [Burkholderia vietnamiensis]HDR9011483.1 hypothetical protein [Burkholderia vietnamiensis]HDR9016615.1 hypothetical protein [Burkholderia vietnamiensis]
MNEIKILNKRIEDGAATIERLGKQIEKLEKTKRVAEVHDCGVSGLQVQRRDALVEAHVAGVKPDTSKIDAEIAKAEKLRESKKHEVVAAEQAIEILREAVTRAEDDVAAAESEKAEIVAAFLRGKYGEAERRYFEVVEALRGPVEEMVAAEKAWRIALGGRRFDGRASNVLSGIRSQGLRVSWEHSALRDPEIAAGYTENFRDAWYVPGWADERSKDFAEKGALALVDDLKSVGFDVAMPMSQVKEAEPQVEIEVMFGTIVGEGIGAKLDPVSGARVKGASTSYGPGSRLTMPKSEAALVVANGMARYAADLDTAREQEAQQRMAEMTGGTGRISVHRQAHSFV